MSLFRRKQDPTMQDTVNVLLAITAAAERATIHALRNAHANAAPAVITSSSIRSLLRETPRTGHYPHVQIGSSSAAVR